jgi:hypothetical protein
MISFEVLVLLVVTLVVLLALREVWRVAPSGTAGGRVGRAGSVIVAVIALAVATRLLVAPLPSERTLTWKPGFGGDPARTDVVRVEVERPGCAPAGTGWLATPAVTYTPVAVFITFHMADTFYVPGCTGSAGHQGDRLPLVGNYLTGTYLDVHLTAPLGGRTLFDGGGLLPEPRLGIP